MNHHHEHEHDVVNGGQVNGSRPTEEELDAYQNQLTDEAIQDQVKVLKPRCKTTLHVLFLSEIFFIAQEKRVLLYRDYEKYCPKSLSGVNGSAFRGYMRGESSEAELAGIISSSTSSFNDLSQRINRCEVALRDDLNRSDLAGLIRRIQDNEKIKLEAVIQLYC